MAFLAPLAAGLLGLGSVGSAVFQIGAAFGLSFLAKKLRPKQKSSTSGESRGVRVGLKIDTNPTRQAIIGEVATGGSLAYWQLSGTNNDVLHMVVALADHECTSLQGVLVGGKLKSWNSTTGEVAGYGPKLVVRFYTGATGQTADAEVIAASGGRWTTNEKGVGVCYAVVKLTYDEKLFPEGIPELAFVVRGAKLYDPRTGSTAYSDNVAVAIYNILRGISAEGEKLIGMNVPVSAIRLADAQAAANACDEAVALAAGGTEKRYRCGIVFDASQSNRDVIETLLGAMAGELIATGGLYRIMAGVAQTPVASLTDADLIPAEPFTTKPKRPRNELTNAILGSFTDPARGYAQVALPPRTSSADETADGGIRLSRSFDLVAVTSRAQGQRILEVERKRARRMVSASFQLRARYFGLEPGDWVSFSSDRRGFSDRVFAVHSASGNADLTTDIVLIETDAAIDDWSAGSDEIADDQVIDLASAGPSLSTVSGVALLALEVASAGGIKRPALQIQWTAIADQTVSELEVEFRKVGDTVALKPPRVSDPTAGTYTWATGVQSGATYEARIRPITRPARAVDWTPWVPTSTNTGDQVVAVAAIATGVAAGVISATELDAQSRFLLSLTFETDELLGSVANQIKGLLEESEKAGLAMIEAIVDLDDAKTQISLEKIQRETEDLALASQIELVAAQINDEVLAAIRTEQIARATADSSLASQITTALTRVGASEARVDVIATSLNGVESKFGVVVTAGYVTGIVQLDASAVAGSSFTVVADKFRVALPGTAGGAPVPVFTIGQVNGQNRLVFRGDMYGDGSIVARHLSVATLSAISADFGSASFTGVIRGGPNGKLLIDLNAGRIRGTA